MGDERTFAGDDHQRDRAHPSPVDPVELIRQHGRAGGWRALDLIEDQIRDAARTGLDVLVSGADRDLRAALAGAVHEVTPRRTPLVALGPGRRQALRALAGAVAAGGHPAAFPEGVGTLYLDDVATFDIVQQNLVSDFLERRVTPGPRPGAGIRVLSGCDSDLYAAVARGRFSGDLFYRLNPVHVSLPRA